MLSSQDYLIEILHKDHVRTNFDCGEAALNNYLTKFASQHAKTNISRTFVATNQTTQNTVVGFYTLSAGSITFDSLPDSLNKKLPQYPIPVARLGRLAVDKSVQGIGLGEKLLMNALHRCLSLTAEMGIAGIVVDAKHDKAKNFYVQYGFCELTNSPLALFIPIQSIAESANT